MVKTIIVVGGGRSGLKASAAAREYNERARIILIPDKNSFLAERFWHYVDQDVDYVEQEIDNLLEEHQKNFDIEIHNVKARAIDVDSKFLLVKSLGQQERIRFDSLIYAGILKSDYGSANIIGSFSFKDLVKVQASIKSGSKLAVIIGVTPKSIKAAFELKNRGLKVRLVFKDSQILYYSKALSRQILARLSSEFELYNSPTIKISEGSKLKIELANALLDADLLVEPELWPEISLLEDAGALIEDGFVQVDDQMRTTLPDIFAAGSTIKVPRIITGERVVGNANIELKTAQVAGQNAALDEGLRLHPQCHILALPIADTLFVQLGLSKFLACNYLGADNILTLTHKKEIYLRIVIEKKTHFLIGAEISGAVDKYIDLLSMAIHARLTPQKLLEIETFSVRTPLIEALEQAQKLLTEKAQAISADKLALWSALGQEYSLYNVDQVFDGSKKAIHLPLQDLRKRIKELDRSRAIIFYSESGEPSILAQQITSAQGFTKAYHLEGGLDDWLD